MPPNQTMAITAKFIIRYVSGLSNAERDVYKRQMLQERMKKEVIVENDANAAAYGEYQAGALKGADVYKRQDMT